MDEFVRSHGKFSEVFLSFVYFRAFYYLHGKKTELKKYVTEKSQKASAVLSTLVIFLIME